MVFHRCYCAKTLEFPLEMLWHFLKNILDFLSFFFEVAIMKSHKIEIKNIWDYKSNITMRMTL